MGKQAKSSPWKQNRSNKKEDNTFNSWPAVFHSNKRNADGSRTEVNVHSHFKLPQKSFFHFVETKIETASKNQDRDAINIFHLALL